MFSIGNTFGRRTAKPVEPSQVDSPTTREGAQLALDLASSAYQGKVDELAEARSRLESLEREAGKKDADGDDVTSATLAVQAQQATVMRLERSASVLLERRTGAEVAVQDAVRAEAEQAKDAARERLLALMDEGEELFVRVKLFREDVHRETASASAVGGIAAWGERDIKDYFDFFLKRANRGKAADLADSGAFMKYPSWGVCVKYACGKIKP